MMDKFKGVWVSTKQENFGAFLSALGAGVVARGTAKTFTTILEIKYDGGCTFTVKSTLGPHSREKEFTLGEVKNDEWTIGGPVVGGWKIDGDELIGEYNTKDHKKVITRRSVEGDMLVQRMNIGTVSCTRWFQKK